MNTKHIKRLKTFRAVPNSQEITEIEARSIPHNNHMYDR